jgi:hypothetical protein
MDESAEMKVAIPRVGNGTGSISFADSPLERTRSPKSELGIRGTNVKKKVKKVKRLVTCAPMPTLCMHEVWDSVREAAGLQLGFPVSSQC